MNKFRIIFFAIIVVPVLFVGVIIGWFIRPISKTMITSTQIRANSSEYKFINPLLLVSNKGEGNAPEYKSITDTLNDYVNKEITQKKAEDISIYFRNLNSGLYSGVNENHTYSPASMMKIAILIVCLQTAETDPNFLNKSVHVDLKSKNLNVNQFYPPPQSIVPGNTYTVNDLINYMILDSDNNATYLLEYLLGDDKINGLLKELQLPDLLKVDSVDFISPQLYSRFYRILYNSSYLSPDVSEQALKFLTEESFSQGLSAGVPKSVDVAQKFGERTSVDQSGNIISRELHDCGIVYLPNDPYFLCVMTKGQDFTKLQPIISDVSKMVWDYFSSVNKI